MTNFPTTSGRRADVTIASTGRSVSLTLRGAAPTGNVLFQLPSFVGNIASTSAGSVDQATGTVTLASTLRHVTVTLRRAP